MYLSDGHQGKDHHEQCDNLAEGPCVFYKVGCFRKDSPGKTLAVP